MIEVLIWFINTYIEDDNNFDTKNAFALCRELSRIVPEGSGSVAEAERTSFNVCVATSVRHGFTYPRG